jgi:hypothetical protein
MLALLAVMTALAPAAAADVLATGPFSLTPSLTPPDEPRSYFQLEVAPGSSAWDTAIISNVGTTTDRLQITISRGVTAGNSGSAYEDMSGRCSGAGCWVSGLPATVTLAPGARRVLAFTIAVPRRTPPGQYLAGITAESATRPRPVRVGSNGPASAGVIIIDKATVGVAVTVGSLSRLRTAVVIPAVSAGWIGPTPRLYIPVRNTGQAFARATGQVSCQAGGRYRSWPVIMETVLPGGSAVLPVNAPGLASGQLPCTVRLRGSAGLVAWSGTVSVPPRTVTRTYHVAHGVYASLSADGVPPWAIALLVIGALTLTSLLALLALLARRRIAT